MNAIDSRTKNIFARLLLLFALLPLTATSVFAVEPFVHEVSSANVSGHMTRLDHPSVNGKPEQLLFVTPNFGVYNPHTVGVWYEADTGRWTIYNEDRTPLPLEATFNVVAIDPSSPNAFTHTSSPANTIDYYTMISHPASDYDPDATVLITPNWSESYVPGPLGVWYDGERWSVYRQDKGPLEAGVRFNVLVVKDGENSVPGSKPFNVEAKRHRAGYASTENHMTTLDMNDPEDVIFVTHNWADTGPYNNAVPGVWHDGNVWKIFNHGRENIQNGAIFNCFVFEESEAAASNAAPAIIDRRIGWMKVRNAGQFAARFTLTFRLDGSRHIVTSGTLQKGSFKIFRVPMRATDLNLVGEITDGKNVREVVVQPFSTMPNMTYSLSGDMSDSKWAEVPGEGL
ncbi:MAG: hypothetical protein AAFX93_18190 [Verrucomicrobiota bacterium]